MNEHKFTFVEPGRDRRKRREALKHFAKQPRSAERAAGLAKLALEFHDGRELNLAMDTAQQAINDDEQGVAILFATYMRSERADKTIEDLAHLADMARWLSHSGLQNLVRAAAYDEGLDWCGLCDGRERERRLDTLRRRFDEDLATEIDLALL